MYVNRRRQWRGWNLVAGLKDHQGINSWTVHTGYVCFKKASLSHVERRKTSMATAAKTGFDLMEVPTERTNGPFWPNVLLAVIWFPAEAIMAWNLSTGKLWCFLFFAFSYVSNGLFGSTGHPHVFQAFCNNLTTWRTYLSVETNSGTYSWDWARYCGTAEPVDISLYTIYLFVYLLLLSFFLQWQCADMPIFAMTLHFTCEM